MFSRVLRCTEVAGGAPNLDRSYKARGERVGLEVNNFPAQGKRVWS